MADPAPLSFKTRGGGGGLGGVAYKDPARPPPPWLHQPLPELITPILHHPITSPCTTTLQQHPIARIYYLSHPIAPPYYSTLLHHPIRPPYYIKVLKQPATPPYYPPYTTTLSHLVLTPPCNLLHHPITPPYALHHLLHPVTPPFKTTLLGKPVTPPCDILLLHHPAAPPC